MKKLFLIVCSIVLLVNSSFGQTANDKRMEWWRDARFGMFIHWGVYAVPAGMYKGQKVKGIGEWIMNFAKIPVNEYLEYAKSFNPDKYDPEAWVKMAKDAGMKYIVITAKHHDGFALFDSKVTNWDIVDATPYKKDLLKPLAEACRKHGIKLGLYYSQAQDWVHPGAKAYLRKANRGYNRPDSAKIDSYVEAHEGHWDPYQESKTFEQYIDQIAVPQVKEILTNYGDIAVLWWDTPNGMDLASAKKLNAVLAMQPNIISNDRLMKPDFPGDLKTPEQRIPNLSELDGKDWETCMTMNDTWGFKSFDSNWKSTTTLVRNLIDIASKGGNYLLNVGPTAKGEIPVESIQRLKEVGEWMKLNGESIYETTASPFGILPWGRVTKKENGANTILYFSVFDWPNDGKLMLPAFPNQVIAAKLLSGGDLKVKTDGSGIEVKGPDKAPNAIASVIKIEVKGKVATSAPAAKAKAD